MINVESSRELPSINRVLRNLQGLALLDAILMPDWEMRYFSFNSKWDHEGKEMMGSMRDGSGFGYFLLFSERGAVGKSFDASSKLQDWTAALDIVPDYFSSFKEEEAFSLHEVSFFFWRGSQDLLWSVYPASLSSYSSVKFLAFDSDKYCDWAERYYERAVDREAARRVFDSLTVNEVDLRALNADVLFSQLEGDIIEITG